MSYFKCIYLVLGGIYLIAIHVSFGEMYTSVLNVKEAIHVERKLIDHLQAYIEHESERLQDIKR